MLVSYSPSVTTIPDECKGVGYKLMVLEMVGLVQSIRKS